MEQVTKAYFAFKNNEITLEDYLHTIETLAIDYALSTSYQDIKTK